MSEIDSSMDPHLREVLLSEVRTLLPGFLSAASVERDGPINAAIELLNLPEADLRQILAVHAMLAGPVRRLVASLPTGIRRPITASVRPHVAGRSVTSGIDWAATARRRATSSPLGGIWVTRPASRIFDVPENRALAWLLRTLEERGSLAVPPSVNAPGTWGQEIRATTAAIHKARRVAWLELVPIEWPGDEAYFRLKADRMGFYRLQVAEAARYLRRLVISPTAEDVVDALSQRYFEPTQDWKLFEIAVLLRITKALATGGARLNPTRLFNDPIRRPFAAYQMTPSRQVRIWYQRWPPSTAPSELSDAIDHYELTAGSTRPDIVIEICDQDTPSRALLLELKASSSQSYFSSGLSQLLGYLRDRPRLFSAPGSAWLVVPPNSGFVSKPAGQRSLWVTSSDHVAQAVYEVATPSTTNLASSL